LKDLEFFALLNFALFSGLLLKLLSYLNFSLLLLIHQWSIICLFLFFIPIFLGIFDGSFRAFLAFLSSQVLFFVLFIILSREGSLGR
jgi:hypothetical protein